METLALRECLCVHCDQYFILLVLTTPDLLNLNAPSSLLPPTERGRSVLPLPDLPRRLGPGRRRCDGRHQGPVGDARRRAGLQRGRAAQTLP